MEQLHAVLQASILFPLVATIVKIIKDRLLKIHVSTCLCNYATQCFIPINSLSWSRGFITLSWPVCYISVDYFNYKQMLALSTRTKLDVAYQYSIF